MKARKQGNLVLVDFDNGYRIIIEETANRASLWDKSRVMTAWSEVDHALTQEGKIAFALKHLLDEKDYKAWGAKFAAKLAPAV